ncbi:testis-expressed protein 13B [Ictidomys tridecemlineatus]|uniref:testis-expressed protein 13B-like n=1 Tax=Ictidomys tridecemlineatus TaxID=43179 RepID=UPI00038BDA95|nr:testis-expressed protein 13B-like [Ictidomys tridecemlineatus]KAG3272790.1 testis-expressed protein 13B-like [Ictidomys tridecemlineatus]
MAVNFNDPASGFYQREVVDFINEQILRNGVSADLYTMQTSKTWGELEKKLQAILTDSAIPESIKKSCAWSALALAVRLARKQKKEYTEKVKKLQEQVDEQKLFINVLIGMVNRLRDTQQKEREKAQFQLQQSLIILHRIEGERNLLRSELLKVLSTPFQGPEVMKEEENGNETKTLNKFAFAQDTGIDWTGEETVGESGQEAAAATAATITASDAEGEEKENLISVSENDQELTVFSCSGILEDWSQASPLLPLSLSEPSCSFLPSFLPAETARETVVVSPGSYAGSSWKGKRLHTRKFLPERFKPKPGSSHSTRCGIKRREGDWDCEQCHLMNFSWRNVCFKCGKFPYTKESVQFFLPVKDLSEF